MEGYRPPILDCAEILKFHDDPAQLLKFSTEFGKILKENGFLYLTNHGVSEELIEGFLGKSKEFFNLPQETKEKYKSTCDFSNFFGYLPTGIARAANENEESSTRTKMLAPRECFAFLGPAEAQDESVYPAEVPDWMPMVQEFSKSIFKLANIFLRALGIHMGVDENFFLKFHQSLDNVGIKSPSSIRSMCYFPMDPSLHIHEGQELFRLREHSDSGMFTFLFQDDAEGLESKLANGEWIQTRPIQNSILLQVGEVMEMVTGGHFRAVPHRVRLTNKNSQIIRQSLAFFLHPDGNSHCAPVVPLKEKWIPPYPRMAQLTHDEFIMERRRMGR